MSDESAERRRRFLEEVVAVCRRHGLSIAHEDSQGAFIVEVINEFNVNWLLAAFDEIDKGPPR